MCRNMKLTHLEDLYNALKTQSPEIILEGEIIKKAYKSLDRMLEYV